MARWFYSLLVALFGAVPAFYVGSALGVSFASGESDWAGVPTAYVLAFGLVFYGLIPAALVWLRPRWAFSVIAVIALPLIAWATWLVTEYHDERMMGGAFILIATIPFALFASLAVALARLVVRQGAGSAQ